MRNPCNSCKIEPCEGEKQCLWYNEFATETMMEEEVQHDTEREDIELSSDTWQHNPA